MPVKAGVTFEGPHLLLSRLGFAGRHWAVPDDLLLLPGAAGGRLMAQVPADARLSVHRRVSCEECGKGARMALQLRIMPTFLEQPDLAEKYRGSYQHPANLVIHEGELVIDDSGDLNSDGRHSAATTSSQLIQKSAPSTIVWHQCDIRIATQIKLTPC